MSTAFRSNGACAATRRWFAFLAALTIALVAAALSAAASPGATNGQPRIQAFQAKADAFVSAEGMAKNFGRAHHLKVDASPTARTYLRFNVDVKEAGIEHVCLMIYSRTRSRAGYQVRLADDRWLERRITLLNAPSLSPAFIRSGPLKAGAWNAVDVTALADELGGGTNVISLALTSKSSKGVDLASRETGLYGPRLVVEHAASVEQPPPDPTPGPTPTPTPTPTPITPPTEIPGSLLD
jgi:hypothetical protein